MTTTCQEIYVRARELSPAHQLVVPTPADVLAWIEADQQDLFARLAATTRDRFQELKSVASSSGSTKRELDLSALTPAVQRVLVVTLSDGRESNLVDPHDLEAELAPRHTVRGRKLIEVGNDWSASAGAVSATVLYVYGPTAIASTGTLVGQNITVPDDWSEVLVLPLGIRLHQLLPVEQRIEVDYDRMVADRKARELSFLEHLTNFGGVESRRFELPKPAEIKRK